MSSLHCVKKEVTGRHIVGWKHDFIEITDENGNPQGIKITLLDLIPEIARGVSDEGPGPLSKFKITIEVS